MVVVPPNLACLTPRTVQLRLRARWEIARRHPYHWFKLFVWTNKPVADAMGIARRNEVAPFPIDRTHLHHLTELWLHNQRLLVVKYRQALVTWWMAGIVAWDPLFHTNRLIMAQARTEADVIGDRETGDGLLGRAKFILDHVPGAAFLGCKVGRDIDIKEGVVTFARTRSTIQAIAQGGDKIRQRTPSGMASDECAFQPEFEGAYMAVQACLRAGGWFVGATTADKSDKGFTRKVYFDEADA